MALSLLKQKNDREGFMKKAAASKGVDKVRDNWKERWFVLRGKTLEYFKRREDSNAKGSVDLTAAKVDEADEQTGKPFCIRIQETKQIFYYLQASSVEDREAWLAALRKAAGYKTDKDLLAAVAPKTQTASLASWGCLHSVNAAKKGLDSVVITCDADDKNIKIFSENKCLKNHLAAILSASSVSQQADGRSPIDDQLRLYSLTLEFKAENYVTKKVFYLASKKEAEDCQKVLYAASKNNFQPSILLIRRTPLFSGYLNVRVLPSDRTQPPGKFEEMWALVAEKKLLIYQKKDDTIPWRVIPLDECVMTNEGSSDMIMSTWIGAFGFHFADVEARSLWRAELQKAATSLKDMIDQDFRFDESKIGAAAASGGTSPRGATASPRRIPSDSPRAALAADTSSTGDNAPSFVVSWGRGEEGQLGHRTKDSLMGPKFVEGLRSKCVRHISAGDTHSAAVTSGGHVYLWGNGNEMQLGLGEARRASASPYLNTALRSSVITKIACGSRHTLALTTTGEVLAWGSGERGQLGKGSLQPAPYPQAVPDLAGRGCFFIAAAGDHSAAITGAKELLMWGANDLGRLGLGHTNDVLLPRLNPVSRAGRGGCAQVALGGDFCAAVTESGALFTWGSGVFGKLGHRDTEDREEATEVEAFRTLGVRVKTVSLGTMHAVALVEGGEFSGIPFTWGRAIYNGHREDASAPTPIKALQTIISVSASPTHTLLVSATGNLYAFGTNTYGELGNGQPNLQGLVQVNLGMGDSRVQACAAGPGYSVVLCEGEGPSASAAAATSTTAPIEPQSHALAASLSGPISSEDQANVKIQRLLTTMNIAVSPAGPSAPAPAAAAVAVPADIAAMIHEQHAQLAQLQALQHEQQHTLHPDQHDLPSAPPMSGDLSGFGPTDGAVKKKKKPRWKEAVDAKSGKVYYYNTKTREVRWRKPTEEEQQEDD